MESGKKKIRTKAKITSVNKNSLHADIVYSYNYEGLEYTEIYKRMYFRYNDIFEIGQEVPVWHHVGKPKKRYIDFDKLFPKERL